jgi:hypothetical protein
MSCSVNCYPYPNSTLHLLCPCSYCFPVLHSHDLHFSFDVHLAITECKVFMEFFATIISFPYLFSQVSNPPLIPLIISSTLYTFLRVFSARLKYFNSLVTPQTLTLLFFLPCSFSNQWPYFYLPLTMYCCTQFFILIFWSHTS